ncbi:MAG TPA: diguanylate cyclase [Candidatus Polarisedimenticolia bacterium]|jgi:diguanylate cyclase (GGDEF)-like protein|nr:diguanylate cyclase [Candidatus Polarisedimenticolia bacterium]
MGTDAAAKKTRILIVDDDAESVELVWQWLALQGHQILLARGATEALEKIRSTPPDLILLDLRLPPEEGLELARLLKKSPETRTIPLIVMTVRRDVTAKVECLRIGVDDFVTKPFHWDELDATIQSALEKRRLYTALEETNQQLQKANDQLLRLSVTDDLTKLYNDRHLRQRLSEEFKRSMRYGTALSLILMDLDHFKKINDRHGHDCGDAILRQFGEILVDNAREIDIVGRYGGEEFLMILPSTDGIKAAIFAERVRKATEEHLFRFQDQIIRLTTSAGISSVPTNREIREEEQLTRAADEALYRAKEGGRNKVIVDRGSMPAKILDGDLSPIFNASYEEEDLSRPDRTGASKEIRGPKG